VTATEADKERKEITGRAGIVAAGTLASRLLGMARDMVLAAVFSRAATDAWMVAWQLPNLLRQVLAEGAVQTAVLPVLTQIRENEGEEAAQRFFRAVRGLSVCALLLTSLLGVLFAPQLVSLFASGFRDDQVQFERTVELTRWVFPYIFFMGTAALGIAALNTHKRFVVTSFAPALLNISFLTCALLLPGWLGARGNQRILAMALGGLAGGALQVVAQWPSLRAIKYAQLPSFEFSHPGVKEALRRLAPTLLGIGVYSIDVMVGRRLLTELAEGSVTYFSYAMRLCDFSQGIFVMALSAATLPSLAKFAAKKQWTEVSQTLLFSLRMALFVGIAASVLTVVLAQPLVSAVFQRGQFSPHDTKETAHALMAQGSGIFLVAGVRQLVIVFFALGKTKIPVYVAMVDLVVFAALGWGLREQWGHVGVSIAVTAARITQFSLLWFALGQVLPSTPLRSLVPSLSKSALAAAAGGLAALATVRLFPWYLSSDAWLRPFSAIFASIAFFIVFIPCARLLRSKELDTITAPILRRFRR